MGGESQQQGQSQEEKKEGGKGAVALAAMFGPPVVFFALVILFGGPKVPSSGTTGVRKPVSQPSKVENWDKVCAALDELLSRTKQFAIKAQTKGKEWGWEKMGQEYQKVCERLQEVLKETKQSGNFDYHSLWDVAKELRKLAQAPYNEYQAQKAEGRDPNRGLIQVGILYDRGCMQIYAAMVKCLQLLGQKREGSKKWDFEQDYQEACDFYQTLNRE
ncbi:MAG: hypothetical protein DRP63_09790 [Planctomycetota bacterium]|nr:MAG: hypothetical protein DRP63_09790 [Planctomycetota bacterium]